MATSSSTEPLLTASDAETGLRSPVSQRFSRKLLARGAACAAVVGFASVAYISSGMRSKWVPWQARPQLLFVPQDNDPTCMHNSGGTCLLWHCHEDRGPTECRWWDGFKRCMCTEGTCASIDGKCHDRATSTLVASGFTLHNAQWPDYHLCMQHWSNAVHVTKEEVTDACRFTLYQMPSTGGKPLFMMGNVKHPDYLITSTVQNVCEQHHTDPGNSKSPLVEECHLETDALAEWIFKPQLHYILKLHDASWVEPAMTIEGLRTPNRYWYVSSFSWYLDLSLGDPGPQGYWIADPPLPELARQGTLLVDGPRNLTSH